jgi:hypothetical protein
MQQSLVEQTKTPPPKTKSAASSTDTLVNGWAAAIAPPPPVYRAAGDNAAPESEYARLHITRANTLKNQRRAVQVIAKPPMVELSLPPILRPEGALW